MESIKLIDKKTGEAGDYDVYMGYTPQSIVIEIKGGEARAYSSFADIAEDYEIAGKEYYEKERKNGIK